MAAQFGDRASGIQAFPPRAAVWSGYRPADHICDRREQGLHSFAGAGRDRDGRHAQVARQAARVHFEPFAPGFVHQVDRHHHLVGDLHHLHDQVQVALQGGRIGDDDGAVRLAKEDEIARHFFVLRGREQRIGARAGRPVCSARR